MTNAEALIRKGKQKAAEYVLKECLNSKSFGSADSSELPRTPAQLQDLLNYLLNPMKPINNPETLEWCRWIVCGGEDPAAFTRKVQAFNQTYMCGLVWTANFVAYRCSTCRISQCMSLCAECFHQGNHEAEGHDYNMFKSLAGGACDCGDASVMRPSGFCTEHGPCKKDSRRPPRELMVVSENAIPRMIVRLIRHLRQICPTWKTYREFTNQDRREQVFNEMNDYINILQDFCSMGTPMRDIITKCLISQTVYSDLITNVNTQHEPKELADFLRDSQRLHKMAVLELPSPTVAAPAFCECPTLMSELNHTTFLEELLFWTVKYEFPQKLVCLLLNMLPNQNYKNLFTRAFVTHYSRMSTLLGRSGISDSLSNRVIHVSVQLFSNEELTARMSEELHLLHIIVFSIKNMLSAVVTTCGLIDAQTNRHKVVDCAQHIMKEHCYWPLVSDLNNVLSHPSLGLKFMDDEVQLKLWFDFLPMFQGMDVNSRMLDKHIEFEPNTYYAAFSAELEASAVPMWSLVSHLKDVSTRHLSLNVIRHSLAALEKWFKAINLEQPEQVDRMTVTFHLPLHRYFSVFARQAARYQDLPLDEILPDEKMLRLLMMHPLATQVAFHEIVAQMWVRNGLQIKGQAMTYIQYHFSNSMVDADMFLLQVCAAKLDATFFLGTIMERFHVLSYISLDPKCPPTANIEKDQETTMMESFLAFIVSIVVLRTNIGLTDHELTRLEMATLLCMENKPHSVLTEQMPEKNGNNTPESFEEVLKEIGVYREPQFDPGAGTMVQGHYKPAGHVWEDLYDPIYVLLRAFHRKDYQSSMDRFSEFMEKKHNATGTLWPPWRIPKPVFQNFSDPRVVLHSRFVHGLILNLLYKAVYADIFCDNMLSLVVFLLELTVSYPQTDFSGKEVAVSNPWIMHQEPIDLKYETWYPTDCLSDNLRHTVATVFTGDPSPIETSGSMEVDQVSEASSSGMDEPTPYLVETPNSDPSERSSFDQSLSSEVEGNPAAIEQRFSPLLPLRRPCGIESSSYNVGAMSQSSGALIPYAEGAVAPITSLVCQNPLDEASTSGAHALSVPEQALVPIDAEYAEVDSTQKVFPARQELAQPSKRIAATINESIISLLLKLHSKLSGKPDSYLSKAERSQIPELKKTLTREYAESRVGPGTFFVEKVLDKISELDSTCEQSISQARKEIWTKESPLKAMVIEKPGKDENEAKKRRARERQAQMMKEFEERQKKFMNKVKEDPSTQNAMDTEEQPGTSPSKKKKKYLCGNCHQFQASTPESPMGLVVLLQATSVLGHRHKGADTLSLPVKEDQLRTFKVNDVMASESTGRYDELARNFSTQSFLMSVSSGWLGGVHVQSCGHHVHLECHQRYMATLKGNHAYPQTTATLAVDMGEYYCPSCRRLANSALLLPPESEVPPNVRPLSACPVAIGREVCRLLREPPIVPEKTLLDGMIQMMDHLSKSTYPRYISHVGDQHAVILFVSSIARTNLELDIVMRGGTLVKPNASSEGAEIDAAVPRSKPSFLPLFNVLSTYIKYRISRHLVADWSQVSGLWLDAENRSLYLQDSDVPMLLRDTVTLLLHFVLAMPLNSDRAIFTCLVRQLYNLRWLQACLKLACRLPAHLRGHIRDTWNKRMEGMEPEDYMKVDTIQHGVGLVSSILDPTGIFNAQLDENRLTVPAQLTDRVTLDDMELDVQAECLTFMRVAAVLRHYIYEDELPEISHWRDEFTSLAQYLGMADMDLSGHVPSGPCLGWLTAPIDLCYDWCRNVRKFAHVNAPAARRLTLVNEIWQQPRLLRLPKNYDVIFQFYYKRLCPMCKSVPKDPSICLLCGTMVCLREACCKTASGELEAVSHSIECAAGTAPFLAVNSATIVVIRGKRACIWGSIYLDSFGEEDRELKRGKPLFLSKQRYQLLESHWLKHRFDHSNRKWIWHKDQL